MTVVAMKPFHGATREGVEFIERWIRESCTRTGYLIVSTAAKHGEALSEIATSSKAAYEMQWAHFSNLRAIGVTTKRDEVIYFGANLALYSFFLLLIGWLAPGLLGGAIGDMVRSLSSFGIAVLSVGGGLGQVTRRIFRVPWVGLRRFVHWRQHAGVKGMGDKR